jgi:hypothetical protein
MANLVRWLTPKKSWWISSSQTVSVPERSIIGENHLVDDFYHILQCCPPPFSCLLVYKPHECLKLLYVKKVFYCHIVIYDICNIMCYTARLTIGYVRVNLAIPYRAPFFDGFFWPSPTGSIQLHHGIISSKDPAILIVKYMVIIWLIYG